jgi:hypothetical protein
MLRAAPTEDGEGDFRNVVKVLWIASDGEERLTAAWHPDARDESGNVRLLIYNALQGPAGQVPRNEADARADAVRLLGEFSGCAPEDADVGGCPLFLAGLPGYPPRGAVV